MLVLEDLPQIPTSQRCYPTFFLLELAHLHYWFLLYTLYSASTNTYISISVHNLEEMNFFDVYDNAHHSASYIDVQSVYVKYKTTYIYIIKDV